MMKTKIFLLMLMLLVGSMTLLNSCKKEGAPLRDVKNEELGPQSLYSKLILGRWIIDLKEYTTLNEAGVFSQVDINGNGVDYYDFFESGKYEVSIDGDLFTGNWSLSGNDLKLSNPQSEFEFSTFQIVRFTNTHLILHKSEPKDQFYHELTIHLSR